MWDEHHYIDLAIKQYDILTAQGILGIPNVLTIPTHRQPLYSLFITAVLIITGTAHTYKIALIINGLFYVSAIVGTYFLAKQIVGKVESILASFLYATYGNVLFYSHFTYTETATTAFVIWSLVLLAYTHGFQSRKMSFAAGIVTGLATLTRWIAPTFIIGGAFIEAGKWLLLLWRKKNKKLSFSSPYSNIVGYVLLSIGIAVLFHFMFTYEPFLDYVGKNQSLGAQWVSEYRDPSMANTASVRSIMYYFNILQQNTVWMFGLFVMGIITIGIRLLASAWKYTTRKEHILLKDPPKGYLFLLASFCVPYFFLTFITIWKEDRFIVPLYPIIAIISVVFFSRITFPLLKKVLIVITVSIGILNALGGMWGVGPMGQRGLVDYITPKWVPHPRRLYLTPLVWKPTIDKTGAETVIEAIQLDWKGNKEARLRNDVPHEPLQNGLYSRSAYEIRDVYTIVTEGPSDYVLRLSTQESSGSAVNSIFIPALEETAILYKL